MRGRLQAKFRQRAAAKTAPVCNRRAGVLSLIRSGSNGPEWSVAWLVGRSVGRREAQDASRIRRSSSSSFSDTPLASSRPSIVRLPNPSPGGGGTPAVARRRLGGVVLPLPISVRGDDGRGAIYRLFNARAANELAAATASLRCLPPDPFHSSVRLRRE